MGGERHTEAVIDEVIEGVCIAVVGELVVGGRKLLEALEGDGVEIAAEFGVLGEDHSSASHECVDQRLLAHLSSFSLRLSAAAGNFDQRFRVF